MCRPLDPAGLADPDTYSSDELPVAARVLQTIWLLTINVAAAREGVVDEQDGAGDAEEPVAAL